MHCIELICIVGFTNEVREVLWDVLFGLAGSPALKDGRMQRLCLLLDHSLRRSGSSLSMLWLCDNFPNSQQSKSDGKEPTKEKLGGIEGRGGGIFSSHSCDTVSFEG